MHVDSYLEIFTTTYGWALANVISSLIVGTGLVVVPFFVIIFNKWRDAKEQGMQAGGIMSLLEAAQTRLVIALFVATLCFFHAPGISLKNIDLIHKPRATYANPNPQEGSRDKGTGTSFDDVMANEARNPDSLSPEGGVDKVPLWWYSVMAISSGINNAIRNGFINSQENDVSLRELQTLALNTGVKSSELRSEIDKFTRFCYAKALTIYKQKHDPKNPKGTYAIDPTLVNLYYPGNRLFMEEPGFYDNIPCEECPRHVGRYKHDPARDTRPEQAGVADMNGKPMCKQWWNDIVQDTIEKNQNNKDMANASRTAFHQRLAGLLDASEDIDEQAKRLAMEIALANTQQFVDYGNFYGISNSTNFIKETAANLGNLEKRLQSAVIKSVLTSALPMIQALLLMGIYAFLPLMIFLSGFDLRAMFIGSIALFSVKIFASLWTVAIWVDEKLVESMYPKGEFSLASYGVGAQATFANGFKETVLSTLLLMLFIGLPMMWVSMMGWLGYQTQNALGNMLSSGNVTASQSAAMGFSRAGQVAGTVLSGPVPAGRGMIGSAVSGAKAAIARKL